MLLYILSALSLQSLEFIIHNIVSCTVISHVVLNILQQHPQQQQLKSFGSSFLAARFFLKLTSFTYTFLLFLFHFHVHFIYTLTQFAFMFHVCFMFFYNFSQQERERISVTFIVMAIINNLFANIIKQKLSLRPINSNETFYAYVHVHEK